MPDRDDQRRTNEKPIKLPADFEQTLKDLLATGPTPKDDPDQTVASTNE